MTGWTLRARLTVVYALLFVLAGGLVLGVTYLLVRQSLMGEVVPMIVDGDLVVKPGANGRSDVIPPDLKAGDIANAQRKMAATEEANRQYRELVLGSLLRRGSLALGVVGVFAAAAAWFLAGRVLRPLGHITATARRVADRNLHERIALDGPRDEVRQLADTFDEMLERLDRSFDGQRRFVANASHELKTPLAINRTVIEVAMARPDAPPEVHRLGDILLDVNARHERLIDGLLVLARSERVPDAPEAVDLAALAGQVLDRAEADVTRAGTAGAGGVTPGRDLAPAPTAGDRVLLEQVVANLVRNALLYNVPDGWAEVRTGVVDGRAVLTVANSGPVVGAHEVPLLFEPFRRLADRVGSGDGTGLGLSIVRTVARSHGGDATAVPRDQGGLVVTVTLPLVR